MRRNAKKPKPNPNNNPRRNIRSSSIRAIIGDRRFDQFSRVNTEGTTKVKSIKVGDAEVHDSPNLGQNSQFETTVDPRGSCGDFAAKTSEYAFFKRTKENTHSNVHEHPNSHDNQLSKAQQSHNFTKEDIPNVQKESIKYAKSSSPNEKEQNEAHYSFLSPPCRGSKYSAVDGTNVQNVRPGLYNCLSPSVGSKVKTSEDKGVFSAKREKLRHLAADRSLYNVNDFSSEGFDLVSALISRILPVVQDNNIHRDPNQDETDSKSATQIKKHEAYKRKLMESQKISYLDDGFFRPTKKLEEKNLLEWNLTDSFSSDHGFCRPTKKLNEKNLLEWNPTDSFSYDDGFCRQTKKLKEKNVLEWNPTESFSCGPSQNYGIRYNRCQTEDYNREYIKSHHRSCLDILEWNPIVSFDESRNFQELDESRLYEQPQRLLLRWDDTIEKDESFLASSPSITRHIRNEHLLTSSISPYTPKHLMAVEDCSIKFPFQESFQFLIQSPGLDSLVNDEKEEDFVYGSDRFLNSDVNDYGFNYMESFFDKRFDHTDYPLLLHDSSRNDEF